MTQQWWKLFLADRLMEAHLLLGILQGHGVAGLLVEANDLATPTGFASEGVKVFVPLEQKDEAIRLFQDRFKTREPGPFTGALQPSHVGPRGIQGVVPDVTGEETLGWTKGDYDPLAKVDFPADALPEGRRRCTHCETVNKKDARWCEKCGENFPEE